MAIKTTRKTSKKVVKSVSKPAALTMLDTFNPAELLRLQYSDPLTIEMLITLAVEQHQINAELRQEISQLKSRQDTSDANYNHTNRRFNALLTTVHKHMTGSDAE